MAHFFRAAWPLIILVFLAALLAFGLTRNPGVLPSEMIDRPVPEFELSDLYLPNIILEQDVFLNLSLIHI